jgi:hypothetical protein
MKLEIFSQKGARKAIFRLGMVASICNLSYLEGWDRRMKNLRLAWAKIVVSPCLKNKINYQKGPNKNLKGLGA